MALTSTLHWFETDVLTEEGKFQGLSRLNTALIRHAAARSANRRVTLDIDSSESPVHGAQLAESPLTPTLFRQILGRIERLAGHPT